MPSLVASSMKLEEEEKECRVERLCTLDDAEEMGGTFLPVILAMPVLD